MRGERWSRGVPVSTKSLLFEKLLVFPNITPAAPAYFEQMRAVTLRGPQSTTKPTFLYIRVASLKGR